MDLEIAYFAAAGDLDNERMVLRVLADTDIGSYVLIRSGRSAGGEPISGSKSAYWFPDLAAQKGDLIVLYTKTGKAKKKKLPDERTSHIFYWHKRASVWDVSLNKTAVLLEVIDWESKASQ